VGNLDSQAARTCPALWLLLWTGFASLSGAREAARLEVEPSYITAEGLDPISVHLRVILGDELVPSLPADFGFRIIDGPADVRTRWTYQPDIDAWRYRFEVRPRAAGTVEVEFFHRELQQVGAHGRFSMQVLASEDLEPPELYRVVDELLEGPLDPEIPLYLLPLEAERLRVVLPTRGSLRDLTFLSDGHEDLRLEAVTVGEVRVTASGEPELPGVRHHLTVRDLTGRRPDVVLPIIILEPCPICGQAHPAGLHPEISQDLDRPEPLPDTTLLQVSDAVVFRTLNLNQPAPTYLETSERVALFEGYTTPALARLDALVEYEGNRRRVFPGLALAGQPADHEGRTPLRLSFRLPRGTTTITFRVHDRDGGERSVVFTLFRVGR
jgi:hypothetical protein